MRENRLGTVREGRLLAEFAIPSTAGLLVIAGYYAIDMALIGRFCGTTELAGVTVGSTLINLTSSVSSLITAGASTKISLNLGGGKFDEARRFLGNLISLSVITGLIISGIAMIFLRQLLEYYGAGAESIKPAYKYTSIKIIASFLVDIYFALINVLKAVGRPGKNMVITISVVVFNAVLEILFVAVFDFGVKGAAFATVIAEIAGVIWLLYEFNRSDQEIRIKLNMLKLNARVCGQTFYQGIPAFLLNLSQSVTFFIINQTLKKFGGDNAITAFWVCAKATYPMWMVCFGISEGMLPIIGYNFGAGLLNRVKRTLFFWHNVRYRRFGIFFRSIRTFPG